MRKLSLFRITTRSFTKQHRLDVLEKKLSNIKSELKFSNPVVGMTHPIEDLCDMFARIERRKIENMNYEFNEDIINEIRKYEKEKIELTLEHIKEAQRLLEDISYKFSVACGASVFSLMALVLYCNAKKS